MDSSILFAPRTKPIIVPEDDPSVRLIQLNVESAGERSPPEKENVIATLLSCLLLSHDWTLDVARTDELPAETHAYIQEKGYEVVSQPLVLDYDHWTAGSFLPLCLFRCCSPCALAISD